MLLTHHDVVPRDQPMTPLIILGAGYVGHRLYDPACRSGRRVWLTSRTPVLHLGDYPMEDRLEFDLERPETWGNVPQASDIIWCFPAAPVERVAGFMRSRKRIERLVVLASTSAYRPAGDTPIDETWPLDTARPRVQGEEFLRARYGAIVLRIAGIYGPGRNPLDWIRNGRVPCAPRTVNLIHVEDLVAICLLALEQEQPGEAYNISDGHPRMWSDICRIAHERWQVPVPPETPAAEGGKRIATDKFQQAFRYRLKHPDLYRALEELERPLR